MKQLKEEEDRGREEGGSAKGKVCLICNKKHTPLCPIPPGWRKEQREAAKEAKKYRAAVGPWRRRQGEEDLLGIVPSRTEV